jgi:hypothetical protein
MNIVMERGRTVSVGTKETMTVIYLDLYVEYIIVIKDYEGFINRTAQVVE